jgi:hypothetical protein
MPYLVLKKNQIGQSKSRAISFVNSRFNRHQNQKNKPNTQQKSIVKSLTAPD